MDDQALPWLALSRSTLDRAAELRRDETWLSRAWADPATRVLVVHDGEALVRRDQRHPSLVLSYPRQVPETAERYLLGVEDGVAYFAASADLPVIEGAERASLRTIGALLDDRDAGLLTHAVALHNWHTTHRHCPRCGTATTIASAGHTRVCPRDASEHFPRVDPAVIMLVADRRDRVLLARHPAWPQRWVSILAGFVEPGESLERAVAREVHEEVGLTVTARRYLGSQPWPLPQSLMLGFVCVAEGDQDLRPDREEIVEARWYSREELAEAAAAKDIMLPGSVSIARQLIEHWYGAQLPGSWTRR